MRIDTWIGKMEISVDIDDVLGTLVDHFKDLPEEDLYFEYRGREYVLTVKEWRAPASQDAIKNAIEKIKQLSSEILILASSKVGETLTKEDARKMNEATDHIIGICTALKSEWRLIE